MTRSLRRTELVLLVGSLAFLAAATALLNLVRDPSGPILPLQILLPFAAFVFVVHVVLSLRLGRSDPALLPVVAMLCALGLLAVDRLAPEFAGRQMIWVLVGAGALLVTALGISRIDALAEYRYVWLFAGLALLLVTIVFGVDPNGSGVRIWLSIAGNSFQPSEVTKVALALFLAGHLARERQLIMHSPLRIGRLSLPPLAYLSPLVVAWGLAMALLVFQHDLGPALLLYMVFLAMLYAATGRTYLGVGALLLVLGAIIAYTLFDYVQLRTRIWLDPWPYATGDGYQLVQALFALAAGGVVGSGLGYGYPEYVPAVHTDFVLAGLGEELGLLGTLAIVALYLILVFRAFRIAMLARSEFASLLAVGLGTTLGIQACIILAGNLRLMPITGITLPFLSYGGSSIVANFVMVGLLLRISAESNVSSSPTAVGEGG